MVSYENSAVMSLSRKNSSNDFRPHQIFILDKEILSARDKFGEGAAVDAYFALTGAEPKQVVASKLREFAAFAGVDLSSGFALFRNRSEAELCLSIPGVTVGGYIIISNAFVLVAYDAARVGFCVVKEASLSASFTKLTGLNYLSTRSAIILGHKPECMVATTDGCFCSYPASVTPVGSIDFEYALYSKNVPLAYYGVRFGSLTSRIRPNTRKGIASYLLTDKYTTNESRDYRESVAGVAKGLLLTDAQRAAVRQFVRDIKNGASKLDLSFAKVFRRPDSSATTTNASLGILLRPEEDDYLAPTTRAVAFLSLDDNNLDGAGITEWINDPVYENCQYILINGSTIEGILDRYEFMLADLLTKRAYLSALYTLNSVEQVNRDCVNVKPSVNARYPVAVRTAGLKFPYHADRFVNDVIPVDGSDIKAPATADGVMVKVMGGVTTPFADVLPVRGLVRPLQSDTPDVLAEKQEANTSKLEPISKLLEVKSEPVSFSAKSEEDDTIVVDVAELKRLGVRSDARAIVQGKASKVLNRVVQSIVDRVDAIMDQSVYLEGSDDIYESFADHSHWWPFSSCTCHLRNWCAKYKLSGNRSDEGATNLFALGGASEDFVSGKVYGQALSFAKDGNAGLVQITGSNGVKTVTVGQLNSDSEGNKHLFKIGDVGEIVGVYFDSQKLVLSGQGAVQNKTIVSSGRVVFRFMPVPVSSIVYGWGCVARDFDHLLKQALEASNAPSGTWSVTVSGTLDPILRLKELGLDPKVQLGSSGYRLFQTCDNWQNHGDRRKYFYSPLGIPGTGYEVGPLLEVTLSFDGFETDINDDESMNLRADNFTEMADAVKTSELAADALIQKTCTNWLVNRLDEAGILDKCLFVAKPLGKECLLRLKDAVRVTKLSSIKDSLVLIERALERIKTLSAGGANIGDANVAAVQTNIDEIRAAIAATGNDVVWYRSNTALQVESGIQDLASIGAYLEVLN